MAITRIKKPKEKKNTKDLMTKISEICTIAGFLLAVYIFIKELL